MPPEENTFENPFALSTDGKQTPVFLGEKEDARPGIKVIGVGGGGSNAVSNMYKKGINGVDFYICNTDMQALHSSDVPGKIAIGAYGAGGRPEIAAELARENAEAIIQCCEKDTRMVFLAACMGGGTGTGAAPVIAETIKQIKLDDRWIKDILIVAVVTMPFHFEGRKKINYANKGISELRQYADSVIVINNDKLRTFGNLPLLEAFSLADEVIYTATKSIAQIITEHNYVNTDFHDVYNIMSGSKTALMGCGIGSGEDRIKNAVEAASSSVLLDDQNIRNAKGCLLSITYSSQSPITLDEFDFIQNYVLQDLINSEDPESDVIWGTGIDESLGDKVQVTLVATGFDMPEQEQIEIKIEGKTKTISETQKEGPTERVTLTDEGTIETPQPEPQPQPVATADEPPMEVIEKPVEQAPVQTPANTVPETPKTEERIFTDIETGEVTVVNPAQPVAEQPKPAPAANEKEVIDFVPGDIDITVNSKPAETPETPATAQTPQKPTNGTFNTNDDFRERIRKIRETLSKIHGPDTAAQMSMPSVHVESNASASEATGATIGADGSINLNPGLYSNAD